MNYPISLPFAVLFYRFGFTPIVRVEVIHDAEAGVYIATSQDLAGLIIEVDNIEALRAEIKEAIVNLLKLNHQELKNPHADLIYKDHIALV